MIDFFYMVRENILLDIFIKRFYEKLLNSVIVIKYIQLYEKLSTKQKLFRLKY